MLGLVDDFCLLAPDTSVVVTDMPSIRIHARDATSEEALKCAEVSKRNAILFKPPVETMVITSYVSYIYETEQACISAYCSRILVTVARGYSEHQLITQRHQLRTQRHQLITRRHQLITKRQQLIIPSTTAVGLPFRACRHQKLSFLYVVVYILRILPWHCC